MGPFLSGGGILVTGKHLPSQFKKGLAFDVMLKHISLIAVLTLEII